MSDFELDLNDQRFLRNFGYRKFWSEVMPWTWENPDETVRMINRHTAAGTLEMERVAPTKTAIRHHSYTLTQAGAILAGIPQPTPDEIRSALKKRRHDTTISPFRHTTAFVDERRAVGR